MFCSCAIKNRKKSGSNNICTTPIKSLTRLTTYDDKVTSANVRGLGNATIASCRHAEKTSP